MTSKPLFHKQETPYSCVPACLRMVLSSHGRNFSEAELRDYCDCTLFGTEALKAVDAARRLGFPGTAKHTLTSDKLEALVHEEHYPIAFIDTLPLDGIRSGHAVVVIDFDGDNVGLFDPLHGERLVARGVFNNAWSMMHNLAIVIET